MSTFDQIKRKVTRPPSAQNWVRLNAFGDLAKTTKLIANFALSIPAFNYVAGVGACKHKVELGLDLDTAIKSVRGAGAPAGRESNESLVRAFYRYDESRRYGADGWAESFDDGAFRVSRQVRVPTQPSFTERKSGLLIPISVCGWQEIPFENIQLRLFMTVLEIGLYSYADYRKSPAEVVMFPMTGVGADRQREALIIRRGDYAIMSERQLREQSELYVQAQADALPIVEQTWRDREVKRERERQQENSQLTLIARDPDLFGR